MNCVHQKASKLLFLLPSAFYPLPYSQDRAYRLSYWIWRKLCTAAVLQSLTSVTDKTMKSCFQIPINLRRHLGSLLIVPVTLLGAIALPNLLPNAQAQTGDGRAMTVRSDIQEANSQTGVVTARGNVQIDYPARQIQATAAQAQYFSRERRIVLTGNVYVLQQGNSLRGEVITYLIDEGRFVAMPKAQQQVESIYIVSDPQAPTQTAAPPVTPPFNPQPAFKTPVSNPAPGR